MNVVCTGDGRFVEVQGTAEGEPFDRTELNALLDLAVAGLRGSTACQRAVLAEHPAGLTRAPHRESTAAVRRRCWW